jgi:RES domain-containing protein
VALKVAAVTVKGRWVKHTYPGSPPLPERDPPPDNRWQRGDVVDALYLADSEATAWAEWYRHLAERMIPPLAQMPRELWTWQVNVKVADLSTPKKLAVVGLDPPSPVQDSWTSTNASASFFQKTAGEGC